MRDGSLRDLVSPLLSVRVVSSLTGLSPQAIRRWEGYGVPVPSGAGSRRPRPATRLYSWRDVEQLQQATYLVENRGVSMAIAGLLLSEDEVEGKWVIARPKPRPRVADQGKVVAVGVPRSAERQPRRTPLRKGRRTSQDRRNTRSA